MIRIVTALAALILGSSALAQDKRPNIVWT